MIARHNPRGDWMTSTITMLIETRFPDGKTRRRDIAIDFATARYEERFTANGHQVEVRLDESNCRLTVDGTRDVSPEVLAEIKYDCARARMFRDYHSYLWGLPMKLRDPGTIITPQVEQRTFEGRNAWVLHARYAEGVGSDRWEFYARPDDFEMIGYAFEKPDGKGEFIVLEGTLELADGTRIPKVRTWFLTRDRKLLGTDVLISAERR